MLSRKECIIWFSLVMIVVPSTQSSSGAPWTKYTGDSKESKITKKTDITSNIFDGMTDDSIFMNDLPATQKRSLFGPFSPFSPFSPFNPYLYGSYIGPYNSLIPNYYQGVSPSYSGGSYTSDTSSRRRRSLDDPAASKKLRPPPSYPGLSPISEEPEESKLVNNPNDPSMLRKTPIEYLPPMFGPMIDPSMFIAKKTIFLDNLFKTLATSTPAPLTTDDTPTTKSTIVPPNFWLPSSITPDPMEYNNKVVNFLDKLFDSLKMNRTTPSDDVLKNNFVRSLDFDTTTQKKVARSLDDIAAISAAKDSIVDSILSELIDLKGDMVSTLDDLVNFQKISPPAGSSKKAFKAGPWSKFGSVDTSLPFKQRMMMLGQVFDMLTGLQRNITSAVQEAVTSKLDNMRTAYDIATPGTNINMTLLEAIKSKLLNLDPYNPIFNSPFAPKYSRTVPQTATSFWVAYPQYDSSNTVKRQIEEDALGRLYNEINTDEIINEMKVHQPRAVEMQMHQGYQSMPPGTVESVQAGGGSSPGREGGGINLLIQMPVSSSRAPTSENEPDNYWEEYSRNQNRRHHHNHH